jgi:Na+(H+)/acetate symporter ActP
MRHFVHGGAGAPFVPGEMFLVPSVKDLHNLSVVWTLPPMRHLYESKPQVGV